MFTKLLDMSDDDARAFVRRACPALTRVMSDKEVDAVVRGLRKMETGELDESEFFFGPPDGRKTTPDS